MIIISCISNLHRSWVGIEVGKVIKNVSCVVMSVRVCCGSVQHNNYSNSRAVVKIAGNWFERFDSLGKSPFYLRQRVMRRAF